MALKVKAVERLLKFDKNDPGSYRYVLKPELYTSLDQKKVIREAALRSGVSQGVMKACWDAAGEVIKAWATEGHAVALPGLGSMRFGLRSKSVEKVEEVKTYCLLFTYFLFKTGGGCLGFWGELALEIGLDDQARHRGCQIGSKAAMLYIDADGNLGIVHRGKGDEG